MTYSLSQLATLEEPLWFCLKAQSKREHLAASFLRREFDLACFSPRLRFRKVTKRGPIWFVEAMFPGYLFAQFVYPQLHRAVIHSAGIQRIVRFGEYVATLDPAVIQAMRRNAADDEIATIDPQPQVGQAVQIVHGPLQGMEALVTRLLPAKERVQVLLEFLGRLVEMEVSAPNVLAPEPVKSSRFAADK